MGKMTLTDLLKPLQIVKMEGLAAGEVGGLTYSSERTVPGDLFFALDGRFHQGWRYAGEAVKKGAIGAVVPLECPIKGIPLVRVTDVRLAMALAADRFYGHPSNSFRLVGVTGTNGKTTTAHMIDSLFRERGKVTGLLGTVGCHIDGRNYPVRATTPEAVELQEKMALMADAGATHVTMEVSSHALEQNRVAGCSFGIAVLTNITGEHLDFHRTFEAYLAAKTKLFARLGWPHGDRRGPYVAVLNADDPHCDYVKKWTAGQVITYGIAGKADVRAVNIQKEEGGLSFTVDSFRGNRVIRIPLKGRFNVYNALAAICVGLVENLTLEEIGGSLSRFCGVAGRFEAVEAGQDYMVVVDYAHTPDGLENVIRAAREMTGNRVITVFGCGGERDRSKRPLMGEAAGRHSDLAILTDDNPRGEDPAGIIADVRPGLERFRPAEGYRVIPDRRKAIAAAIGAAARGDLVLIAGKGHEEEQVYGNRVLPFSDRRVAGELILARLKGRTKKNADEGERDN